MSDLVSLCVTSYNRPSLLKSCIESFFLTNTYPLDRLELVIVDNGSTDVRVLDYINSLNPPCLDFKKVLNEKNDYPYCLRRAKNQARSVAAGDYFIDCPDDHLFVLKSNWIGETISYLSKEPAKISCVCHYSYPLYRFAKANNKMFPSPISDLYYVSELKGYADYHLMSKAAYEDIGAYREDLEWSPNSESEYMHRSFAQGYKRALLKYPASIINEGSCFLDLPITPSFYTSSFPTPFRPVDFEILTRLLRDQGHISPIS